MAWQNLLENSLFTAILGAMLGWIGNRFLTKLTDRLIDVEYTVMHDRVGVSVDDDLFGSVKATWNGSDLSNLWSSKVTISNGTHKDLSDLIVKVYTGNTSLLSERVEVQGSTYPPKYTEDYKNRIQVLPNERPTDLQFTLFRTTREYDVVVLNRGQKIVLHYLTTEANPNNSPNVWVEIRKEGIQAVYKAPVPEVHGVPVKVATTLGLLSSIVAACLAAYFKPPLLAAIFSMLVIGLFAQFIGAGLFKAYRSLVRFFIR